MSPRLFVLVGSVAVGLTACGSSTSAVLSPVTSSPPTASGAPDPGSAPTSPAAGGATPDACVLVTPALLKQTLGVAVKAGRSKPSNIGGSTCDFDGVGGLTEASIVVQVTDKPDTYLPSSFASQYPHTVALTAHADRGFVQTPDSHNGHVQVVKNGIGVDITIYAQAPYSAASEQALAASILSALP